jgi:hypothetical protein
MAEIVDVLAEHVQSVRNQRCACGWRGDVSKSVIDPDNIYAQHRAHVAEALAVVVQEKQAEALEEEARGLGWLGAQGNLVEPDTAMAGVSECRRMMRATAARLRARAAELRQS